MSSSIDSKDSRSQGLAGQRSVDRATTVGDLARLVGGEVVGRVDLVLRGIETVDRAGPEHVAFIRSPKFADAWRTSRAGAALVSRGLAIDGHDASARALIFVPDADLALNTALEHFASETFLSTPGTHVTAVVDPAATISPSASIGPFCVIGPGVVIGDGVVLHSRVTVGRGARIGDGSVLYPGVTLYDRTEIGRRCILHAGVVLGADGFGYRPDPRGGLVKIPHIGNVVLHDMVEIGANTCIDRAKFGSTIIGVGTKIDNMVQIGHGCRIGRFCVICGGVGMSGSVTVGDGVMLGGQVGVADNLEIGAGAKIGGGSGIMQNVPPGAKWFGFPAMPVRDHFRDVLTLRRITKMIGRQMVKDADFSKKLDAMPDDEPKSESVSP